MELIDLESAPEQLLRRLGKDSRHTPYGGANFGTPLGLIDPPDGRLVPNDRFFVRSNGPVPVLDASSWRLNVSGRVRQPLSLSLAELQQLPPRRLEAFLECAGNGRTRFDPVPPGTPWRNDAVGNAVWEGVSLVDVLDLAGIESDVVDIVTQGGDFPEMRRGLPLAVARDPEALVVWRMNDEPLPVAHGGPVRLLVPGWAGIASTKWLIGLEAIDRGFDGFWNVDNYVIWDARGDPLRPVAEMPPKSLIVTPIDGDVVPAGATTIAGWAWSGFGRVATVEVSTDAGQSWCPAMLRESTRRGWRRWERSWPATPGVHRVLARATDERRLRQPAAAPWNAKGYLMNAIQEIAVRVES
ncbi:MAG: sulfite oxidase [Thermomicrobiales bacterium]